MQELVSELGIAPIILLLVVAFFTSMIHGAVGIGGGFLLTVVAAPIIGLQMIVPVLSVTLLISHGSRALFNFDQIDKSVFLLVSVPAIPCIVATALLYGKLANVAIAIILGTVVLLSVPARRWANAHQFVATKPMLIGSGAIYGSISGLSIGPGMLLAPIMLGYGLTRAAFVATLAAVALLTNIIRISIYGISDLLPMPYVVLAICAGIATIPGTWIGRTMLKRSTDDSHTIMVEVLLILGGLGFYWIAMRAMLAS